MRQVFKSLVVLLAVFLIVVVNQGKHTFAASGWSATYYSKPNLTGTTVKATVPSLNFNWWTHAPAKGIPSTSFSATFTKSVYEYAGLYDIQVTSDQAFGVYVDGTLEMSQSTKPKSTSNFSQVIALKTGSHQIMVKYYKSTGSSQLALDLKEPSEQKLPISTDQWYGEFYPSQNLTGNPVLVGSAYTKKITSLNYYWGPNSPASGIPNKSYSAMFQRKLTLTGGNYHLNVIASNGVMVSIDGNTVLNEWKIQSNTMWSIPIKLSKGTHTLVVYYYKASGSGSLKVDLAADPVSTSGSTQTPPGPTSTSTSPTSSSGSGTATGTSSGSSSSSSSGTATGTGSGSSSGSGAVTGTGSGSSSGSGTATGTGSGSNSTSTPSSSATGTSSNGPASVSAAINLTATEWNGAYYPSQTFTGAPVAAQSSTLNFNWGTSSPATGISSGNFSAIFQKSMSFNGKPTDLEVWATNSVQVFLDGQMVMSDSSSTGGFWHLIVTPSQGYHTIVIQYVASASPASLRFETGSPYRTLDLKTPANITAQDIINFFNKYKPGSPLINDANAYLAAQATYGVNAAYLVAHSILETGWGSSSLAVYKHNLYGYGAYDPCPFTCGYYFPNDEASIDYVAYNVLHNYLTPGGSYYVSKYGPNLIGMNGSYATDSSWYNSISTIMEELMPYNTAYYSTVSELTSSAAQPGTYGRDIPSGQPMAPGIEVNVPNGITATVTTNVNFRSLPYVTTSTLIKSLTQGTQVTILGYNTDVSYTPSSTGNYQYRWYRVSSGGQTGWIYGNYLAIQNLLQVTAATNVQPDASTTNPALANLSVNQYVQAVLDGSGHPIVQNGFYEIQVPNNNQTGWVSGSCVKQISQ